MQLGEQFTLKQIFARTLIKLDLLWFLVQQFFMVLNGLTGANLCLFLKIIIFYFFQTLGLPNRNLLARLFAADIL